MEESIAAQLRANIPPADAPVQVIEAPPNTDEPSSVQYDNKLDELTNYKLEQYFGVQLKAFDSETANQLNFIWGEISRTISNEDYGFVAQAIGKLERILGVSQDPQRLFKVYKWLKLDKIRQSTEAEMRSLHE